MDTLVIELFKWIQKKFDVLTLEEKLFFIMLLLGVISFLVFKVMSGFKALKEDNKEDHKEIKNTLDKNDDKLKHIEEEVKVVSQKLVTIIERLNNNEKTALKHEMDINLFKNSSETTLRVIENVVNKLERTHSDFIEELRDIKLTIQEIKSEINNTRNRQLK